MGNNPKISYDNNMHKRTLTKRKKNDKAQFLADPIWKDKIGKKKETDTGQPELACQSCEPSYEIGIT